MIESHLRSILRDDLRFPSNRITFTEFAKGGSSGVVDCWFAHGGRWNPLELKLGSSVVKNLRPTQRRWHRDSLELGIPTYGASIDDNVVRVFELYLKAGTIKEKLRGVYSVDSFCIADLDSSIAVCRTIRNSQNS